MSYYHSYYTGYTAAQFAEDEYFQQWVLNADDAKNEFWNAYLQIRPEQQEAISRARKKVEAAFDPSVMQPLTKEEKLVLKQTIYRKIDQPIRVFLYLHQKSMRLLKIAAILIGIMIIPVFVINDKTAFNHLIVARTGSKETKMIELADSTIVILNANSSITYDPTIANLPNREIYLEGNAYFKVKKKVDHRPFTVHSNNLSIAVLGTEFNVNARSKATEIVLTTGKVKVSFNGNDQSEMYMAPGEKIRVDTAHHVFVRSTTDTLLYKAWTAGKWEFSSTTLQEITNLIHEYYGIETVYENEKAKRLKISGLIPVTDLSSFANILARTLDLNITEQNDKLLIQ